MNFCGLIYLTVRTGDYLARTSFLVVQIRAVDSLPGASFTYHHVKALLPELQKGAFYHPLSVAIIGQRSRTEPKTSLTVELEDQSREIRTTRKITNRPVSQTKVQEHRPTEIPCSLHSSPRPKTKHLALMTNMITEIFPGNCFNVLLSNLFPCPAHLSKRTITGHALQALERSLTSHAPKPHLLQFKKKGETANIFGSSGRDSSQQSDADPEN